MGSEGLQERYINPYTDFGFKKLFGTDMIQEWVFERFFKAAEIAGFSKQELFEYEDSLKVFRDWYSVVKTAEKKGHIKGFEEGEKKKQIEIVKNLKAMGVPTEVIIKGTHLSREEIEKL